MKQLFNSSLAKHESTRGIQYFGKGLHQATELCIPSKVITDVGHFKPLWMNKQALRKARKKYHAWIRYLNTKSGEHYQDYIRACHESRRARKDTSCRD